MGKDTTMSVNMSTVGVIIAAAWSSKRGLDLDKDPEFQARIADPEQHDLVYGNTMTMLDKTIDKKSKRAVFIFAGAILLIILLAIFHQILPAWDKVVDAPDPAQEQYKLIVKLIGGMK